MQCVLGDINVDSMKKIWNERNESMVKYHMSHEFEKLPKLCQNCTDWMIIGEKRWDENGNEINKNYSHEGKMLE